MGRTASSTRRTTAPTIRVATTVTIAVVPVNDVPVAGADSYGVDEDATLTVTAPGVLGNDTDADADPLTAILVSGPRTAR